MNNPGAPQGGQRPPSNDPTARFVKAQHIRSLTNVPEATKAKWISAIGNFTSIVANNSPDSQPYKEAIANWTQMTKLAVESSKAAKNSQNSGPQVGGQSQQPGQQQAQAQAQAQGQAKVQQGAPQMNQTNQYQRPPAWPAPILKHVEETTLYPPPGISMGTPTYETWLAGQKEKYSMLLWTQEMHKASTSKISTALKSLKEKGQELPPQMLAEGKKSSEQFSMAKQKVEQFRAEQLKNKASTQNNMQQQQDQNRSAPPSATMPQQPFNLKLPGHPNQPSNNQGQGQQTGMNPSVEAARNAAANANRHSMSPTQQHTLQMGQAPTSFASTQHQGNNNIGQHGAHQQHPMSAGATQQHRPSLNIQQPMNAIPHQQNAQGGNNGPPQPLSHNQAVARAQGSYSQQQTPHNTAPNTLGQTHGGYSNQGQGQQTPNREHSNAASTIPKISKELPRHLYAPPPAVTFPPARPTMSGPNNGVGGMMGQPAIVKPPAFQLDGDQASGVLSKKKLDELVRQVTGGGEAMNRETLTPEVEEVSSPHLFWVVIHTDIHSGNAHTGRRIRGQRNRGCLPPRKGPRIRNARHQGYTIHLGA